MLAIGAGFLTGGGVSKNSASPLSWVQPANDFNCAHGKFRRGFRAGSVADSHSMARVALLALLNPVAGSSILGWVALSAFHCALVWNLDMAAAPGKIGTGLA